MSNAMQRQIDRLKTDIDQIKPHPIVHHKLMGVPRDSASPEEKAAYQSEFSAAQAAGVFVIQLVGLTKESMP